MVSCLAVASCSTWHSSYGKKTVESQKKSYTLQDMSGNYRASRQVVYKDKSEKLLTKFVIKDKLSNQDLEKTLSFSAVKGKKILPALSQHTTWLDKKRYFSQIKANPKTKSYEVTLKTPEEKWSGKRVIKAPEGNFICFLSQMPECLNINGAMQLFRQEPEAEIDIVVIWDNYPFYAEQYVGLREELYSMATLRIDGLQENKLRISLEVQGQVIFYLFDEDFKFLNTYWVAQGYRLERNIIKEGR